MCAVLQGYKFEESLCLILILGNFSNKQLLISQTEDYGKKVWSKFCVATNG